MQFIITLVLEIFIYLLLPRVQERMFISSILFKNAWPVYGITSPTRLQWFSLNKNVSIL